MKRHTLILGMFALLALGLNASAFAEHGHGSSGMGTEMKMEHKMAEGGHDMAMDHAGKLIRTHTTGGLTLTYRLMDMHGRMKGMAGMEKMADKVASHHLMVMVTRADGGMVHDARVGFLVTGPDGKKMKLMAMGMEGGHGADVDMKQKGKYRVSVKIQAGEKIVKDSFTHVAE